MSGNNGKYRPLQRYAHITGWGKALPERVVSNDDLAQIVDTSDEWIRSRTGIEQRYIAVDPSETTATLGAKAARAALEVADLPASKVDLIICATSSPEHTFPATACLIQDAIGASNAGAFDLSAACSGFVYGLALATGMIATGQADNILVIGAETLSRITDWSDRNTCVLFGDGSGAGLLQAAATPGGGKPPAGYPGDGRRGTAFHQNGWAGGLQIRHARDGHRHTPGPGKSASRGR